MKKIEPSWKFLVSFNLYSCRFMMGGNMKFVSLWNVPDSRLASIIHMLHLMSLKRPKVQVLGNIKFTEPNSDQTSRFFGLDCVGVYLVILNAWHNLYTCFFFLFFFSWLMRVLSTAVVFYKTLLYVKSIHQKN